MKKLIYVTILAGIMLSCHKREIEPGCDTLATVTDLSKTTGCSFGFLLANGTILVSGQHPSKCGHQHHYVLANLPLVEGIKVKIGYEIEQHLTSACKTGTVVEITCIQIENKVKD